MGETRACDWKRIFCPGRALAGHVTITRWPLAMSANACPGLRGGHTKEVLTFHVTDAKRGGQRLELDGTSRRNTVMEKEVSSRIGETLWLSRRSLDASLEYEPRKRRLHAARRRARSPRTFGCRRASSRPCRLSRPCRPRLHAFSKPLFPFLEKGVSRWPRALENALAPRRFAIRTENPQDIVLGRHER